MTQGFLTEAELKQWLEPVQDPELFMGLVELGLIYECKMDEHAQVFVKMTLTSPGCPAADYLVNLVKSRLLENEAVRDAFVEVVFDPKWDPKIMASDECKEKMGIW